VRIDIWKHKPRAAQTTEVLVHASFPPRARLEPEKSHAALDRRVQVKGLKEVPRVRINKVVGLKNGIQIARDPPDRFAVNLVCIDESDPRTRADPFVQFQTMIARRRKIDERRTIDEEPVVAPEPARAQRWFVLRRADRVVVDDHRIDSAAQ
jgi:hypothetical protein